MTRTALALAVLSLAIAATPAAGDVYTREHSVDARISALHSRIGAAH